MVLALGPDMNPRLLLLLPAVVLAACGFFDGDDVDCTAVQCTPCASPLVVRLHFPQGQPRSEAVLEGLQGSCEGDGDLTVCSISANRAGTFEFDVQATGYQKVHLRKTVPETAGEQCCSCGYVAQVVDVHLTPE
jgi:hypothetical protein